MRPSELVHQTSSSTGTGNFTLSPVNGKQTFASAYGAAIFEYYISNREAPEWEYGRGTLSGGALARTTPIKSSLGVGVPADFTAGVKDVASDYPANGIDNASLVDMPANTMKGNNTGGLGVPKDLTVAEVQALLAIPSTLVTSVFGRVGAVVPQTGDYNVTQVTDAVNKTGDTMTGTLTAPGFVVTGDGIYGPGSIYSNSANGMLFRANTCTGPWFSFRKEDGTEIASISQDGVLHADGSGITNLSFSNISGDVANSQLSQMGASTIKGNLSGTPADPQDLTAGQVLGLINAVSKAGDTMSGTLNVPNLYASSGVFAGASQDTYLTDGVITINTPSATPILQLIKPTGAFSNMLRGMRTDKTRWIAYLGNSTAEGGTNNINGSDFQLLSYDDSGASKPTMTGYRNTGDVVFYNDVTAGNNLIGDGVNAALNGVSSTGPILSTGNGKIGYTAGSSVTQLTSKSTTVACNALVGWITMHGESLAAATSVTFQLNNNKITNSLDHINVFHHATGNFGSYNIIGRCTAAGIALITVRNIDSVALAQGITLRFMIFQGSVSGALLATLEEEIAQRESHEDKMRKLLPPGSFDPAPEVDLLEFRPLQSDDTVH